MFKSYKRRNIIDDHYYTIIDDDFIVDVDYYGCGLQPGYAKLFAYCVIKEYEKRQLNVPYNLIRAFRYYYNVRGAGMSMLNEAIEKNKSHNPYYAKYANDIDKYLLLI